MREALDRVPFGQARQDQDYYFQSHSALLPKPLQGQPQSATQSPALLDAYSIFRAPVSRIIPRFGPRGPRYARFDCFRLTILVIFCSPLKNTGFQDAVGPLKGLPTKQSQ